MAGVGSEAVASDNAAENNYLSNAQKEEKGKELQDCGGVMCDAKTHDKCLFISNGQDANLAVGVIAGIPVALRSQKYLLDE